MKERSVQITNELGLHLRAAATLVKEARRWPCTITLTANGATVEGKSLLGITALMAGRGTQLLVRTEGDHEEEAATALAALIGRGFDEDR